MGDRRDHGYEINAFDKKGALFDLDEWNEPYWRKFSDMLRWTAERRIFVQIELWDRFDHSCENWEADPFNPGNNVNYTHAASGLAAEYPNHPGSNEQPFFYTVPALQNNEIVLRYQQAFIDKVLSYSLAHDHVLYCMDNETNGDPAWSRYWAEYVREKADGRGVAVELTEMWDRWNVRDEEHRPTFDHPELYSFIDISQNSWLRGQTNWDNAQWVRHYIGHQPRPINSTKIYGADGYKQKDATTDHAIQTFWRNVIGGFASSRFHRPPAGLGLSELAQTHIRSARLFAESFDLYSAEPDCHSTLLHNRTENEAYLTRVTEKQYAVYLPRGGSVGLNLRGNSAIYGVRWLDIKRASWRDATPVAGERVVELAAPDDGHWLVVVNALGDNDETH